jgi:hypothetical protein
MPWGDVDIDGRPVGPAPVTTVVRAGTHRVRIWGGVNRTQQVEVHAGQVTVLAIDEP